jgi:hypothetical protein
VGRASPLAVDHFVEVVWVLDIGRLQNEIPSSPPGVPMMLGLGRRHVSEGLRQFLDGTKPRKRGMQPL